LLHFSQVDGEDAVAGQDRNRLISTSASMAPGCSTTRSGSRQTPGRACCPRLQAVPAAIASCPPLTPTPIPMH
jgi:hypothetical protein